MASAARCASVVRFQADPGETRDLASEQPEVRDWLARLWDDYAEANSVILPDTSPVCAQADQATRARTGGWRFRVHR
jgi:hypothetical protein